MTWQQAGIALFAFAIICEQGHVLSPIVLAWSHKGLRRIALSRPVETLLLPAIVFGGAMLASFVPCPEFMKLWLLAPIPPVLTSMWLIWWVNSVWNIYHFGAQHYGVSRMLGWHVPKWACVGVTTAIMAGVPLIFHAAWWGWFMLVAIDFNHWLVDIGLSSRVSRYWWLFLIVVAALGCVGFFWKIPRADHIATIVIPWVVQARWGVGFVHFLYSRWVWKLSDPQVRAALGRGLIYQG